MHLGHEITIVLVLGFSLHPELLVLCLEDQLLLACASLGLDATSL